MDFGTFETATIALTVFLLGIFQRYPQNKITVVSRSAGATKGLESIGEIKYTFSFGGPRGIFCPESFEAQKKRYTYIDIK